MRTLKKKLHMSRSILNLMNICFNKILFVHSAYDSWIRTHHSCLSMFINGDKKMHRSLNSSQNLITFFPAMGENQETESDKNYHNIILRKKLLAIARAQSEELLLLRAELEKLRMKNFPSLSQLHYNWHTKRNNFNWTINNTRKVQ